MERRGRKFQEANKLIDQTKTYSLKEAVELAKKTNPAKFDASVELHVNLDVDPRQADQNIRGTVVLPGGSGKTLRVAVFTDDAAAAKTAGADKAGLQDLLAEIEKGQLEFDLLITTPQLMGQLAKMARVLGPKGLMPNPKSGTVATDIKKAISEAKAGKVEYRVDSTGIIHLSIGKVSFEASKLEQNAKAVLASIKAAKPGSLKGNYLKSMHLTTTMGPSIRLNASEL